MAITFNIFHLHSRILKESCSYKIIIIITSFWKTNYYFNKSTNENRYYIKTVSLFSQSAIAIFQLFYVQHKLFFHNISTLMFPIRI